MRYTNPHTHSKRAALKACNSSFYKVKLCNILIILGPTQLVSFDTSCTSGFTDDVTFAHDRLYGGLSIPLRRVTSLRRRAQAKTPLLRRIGCVVC